MFKTVIKFRTLLFTIVSIVATLFISGCNLVVLEPKGMIAAAEKDLLITSVLLMLIVVIPVIILSLVFTWRYRENNHKAKYSPDWSHNTLLEAICWIIPCIIIAILAVMAWISSHQLDPYKPLNNGEKPLTIEVIALNWKWLFIYPEQHIATVNFLALPVNIPIQFLITADAPMNSFQIPQLAGQIYAMAGMQTKLNLIANATGNFRGLSTNFSGDGFSDMNFDVKVSSQQNFTKWVESVQQMPAKLTLETYDQLAQPGVIKEIQYFSYIKKDLFNTIVMKSMIPMSPTALVPK